MFWSKKKNSPKSNTQSKSDALRKQALDNARAAREALGDETIQRITAAMSGKKNSPVEQAKTHIQNTEDDKVVDEILWMLQNKE